MSVTVVTIGLWLLLLVSAASVVYLWILAIASARSRLEVEPGSLSTQFAILVPAHNEAPTIGATVERLRLLDYPQDRFAVYVVADHCADDTAAAAREAGAEVYERSSQPAGSKGAALAWLLDKVIEQAHAPDAVVIFDADTQVDAAFLKAMDAHISAGAEVVQGRHVISNPEDGTYAALADAMMRIDNQFGNKGRVRLGASAKHMGDSICLRTSVVLRYWDELGLTEDYALRQRLLLEGVRIRYAPEAVGYGEAPPSWGVARGQRERWLTGTFRSSRRYDLRMLWRAIRERDIALFDGALQALLPSYSTTAILAALGLAGEALLVDPSRQYLLAAWLILLALLAIYPVVGLLLDRAPARSYIALVVGPVFILWRTFLALGARFIRSDIEWRRTARRTPNS